MLEFNNNDMKTVKIYQSEIKNLENILGKKSNDYEDILSRYNILIDDYEQLKMHKESYSYIGINSMANCKTLLHLIKKINLLQTKNNEMKNTIERNTSCLNKIEILISNIYKDLNNKK
ncbi:unnamed protein product [Rhizophagus irregularis]|nr:unnamed protein product [Rhizophagus irregularis]